MQLCRGPLPDGHPMKDVLYFCPDQDVAAQACNLHTTPALHKFEFTNKKAVLLDAHRAPDEWYAIACQMPQLIVQGDPDAFRRMGCNRFASVLQSCAIPAALPLVHLRISDTITSALQLAQGKCVIVTSNRSSRDEIFTFLRPNGLQPGDAIEDMHGKYAIVHSLNASYVFVDNGRRVLKRDFIRQHIVMSPATLRACEYDTVIVMPDVPEKFARAICRRVRYMIVGVAHSPFGYQN